MAVGDVLGGRDLEMIVGDMGGTLAVVNIDGEILWDVQLTGTLPFPATLGDVNGDGSMDIVVVAVTEDKGCHIYALRGDTGEFLPGYPIALPENAKVTSSVLLVDLNARSAGDRFSFSNESGSEEATTTKSGKIKVRLDFLSMMYSDDYFVASTAQVQAQSAHGGDLVRRTRVHPGRARPAAGAAPRHSGPRQAGQESRGHALRAADRRR